MIDRSRVLCLVACIAAFAATHSFAQIRTDGTLGAAASLTGPHFVIPQTLGRQAGSNLFYSFGTFNIGSGQSATFITTIPSLAYVVSRVTGGAASVINGPLRLEAAGATPAFIFVNPAGVVFGAKASIDVPGAFHVATADYVRFPDGNFYADPTTGSTLSSAAPEAFGFLGNSRGAIAFDSGANITTRSFQPLTIAAGDIQMSGGSAVAPAGEIRVIAVGDGLLEVPFTGALPAANGTLTMTSGASIASPNVGDRDGGTVRVSAGDITLLSSSIASNAAYQSYANSGDVIVNATGHILLGPGGVISGSSDSYGHAGNVTVTADSLTIDGVVPTYTGAGIISENRVVVGGDAGTVRVDVTNELRILNGGVIGADGHNGSVRVNAGEINIFGDGFNGTGISTDTVGSGNGGTIEVTSRGNITLVNGGTITSTTFDEFNAGSVTVTAGGDLSLTDGGNIASNTYSSSTFSGAGNAGSVHVSANNIIIGGGAFILGATGIGSDVRSGTGNAGSVVVEARGDLRITEGGLISSSTKGPGFGTQHGGRAGSVQITAGTLTLDGGGISTSSLADGGEAGSIDIHVAGLLSMLNTGYIESGTYSNANAGSVRIQAGSMSIDSTGSGEFSAGVFSSAFPGASGNAGSIDIAVDGALSLTNGGVITSGTFGSGAGGSIAVRARDVRIDGGQSNVGSQISAIAGTGSSGQPGSVAVTADNSISLSNGGGLSINNYASVPDAGAVSPTSLTISAPRVSLDSFASITAAATANVAASNIDIGVGSLFIARDAIITTAAQDGNGGQIRIHGPGAIVLQRTPVQTSVFGLTGNGGDITVSAPVLVMDSAFIQANTAAANASGGNVTIAVDALVPSGASLFRGGDQPYDFEPIYGFNVIQAAAPTGVSGAIDITSPALDVASSITTVSARVVDTGGLARTPCESSGGSSLAQTGRGGLPPSARGLLSAEGPDPPLPVRSTGAARTIASIACPR